MCRGASRRFGQARIHCELMCHVTRAGGPLGGVATCRQPYVEGVTNAVGSRATRWDGLVAIESSGPVLVLDVHRTPYAIAGAPRSPRGTAHRVGWLGNAHDDVRLFWVIPDDRWSVRRWELAGIPLVTRVVDDDLAAVRRDLGGRWERTASLVAAGEQGTAAVWARPDGSVLLPFDPNEAITTLLTEAYLGALTPGVERVGALARRGYYRVRPVLPRRAQIGLRRLLARRQIRTGFPRWPCEPALHDLYDLLLGWAAEVLGQPVPTLAPWPAGHQWAQVLTHDVETAEGLAGIEVLREIERRHGLGSSWHFVPRRYDLPTSVRDALVREGCEIGVHGLYHDGRDLESDEILAVRLPAMQTYASEWEATGFRAPSMQRSWAMIARLGFDHDMSSPDTDPFQPCRGGCCSWWPVMDGPVVELPLTLAQDHTLFEILQERSPQVWIDKTEVLRARRGLAQVLVHPDYIDVPGVVAAYESYLERYAGDADVWHALPSEVSAWWRSRAASRIVAGADGWEVHGPAAPRAEVLLAPKEYRSTGGPVLRSG
jgi:hypothetical protein